MVEPVVKISQSGWPELCGPKWVLPQNTRPPQSRAVQNKGFPSNPSCIWVFWCSQDRNVVLEPGRDILRKQTDFTPPKKSCPPKKMKNNKTRPKGAKICPTPEGYAKRRVFNPNGAQMSPEVALGSRMAIIRQIDMHIGESGNGFRIGGFPQTQVALGPNGQQKTPRRPENCPMQPPAPVPVLAAGFQSAL